MAQKGLMRILSRKDGKSMVSDDKDSEKVKLTKVLAQKTTGSVFPVISRPLPQTIIEARVITVYPAPHASILLRTDLARTTNPKTPTPSLA